jgi:hypothetical protein
MGIQRRDEGEDAPAMVEREVGEGKGWGWRSCETTRVRKKCFWG